MKLDEEKRFYLLSGNLTAVTETKLVGDHGQRSRRCHILEWSGNQCEEEHIDMFIMLWGHESLPLGLWQSYEVRNTVHQALLLSSILQTLFRCKADLNSGSCLATVTASGPCNLQAWGTFFLGWWAIVILNPLHWLKMIVCKTFSAVHCTFRVLPQKYVLTCQRCGCNLSHWLIQIVLS